MNRGAGSFPGQDGRHWSVFHEGHLYLKFKGHLHKGGATNLKVGGQYIGRWRVKINAVEASVKTQ